MSARVSQATIDEMRLCLEGLFRDAEEVAVNSYATWTGSGWVFNDQIWRKEDPAGFRWARRARVVLGLKPYRYRGPGHPEGRPA